MNWPRETVYTEGTDNRRRSPSGTAGLEFLNEQLSTLNERSDSLAKQRLSPAQNQGSYRIVFWGQCAPGFEVGKVAVAFSKRFKIKSSRYLSQLFSGKVITLKRGLSEEGASRYISAIESMGGICRKESEQKNYFEESEFKQRNSVSFLDEDFDPSTLSLAPKDEFSTEF